MPAKVVKDILDLRRRQKGFTLVELLVVIAIIGVLATLVLLQLGTARARARDTKRIADVNQIRTAVEQYFDDNGGKYPTSIDGATIGKYLTQVPKDPLSGNAYNYAFDPGANPTKYQVWATLEQSASALNGSSHIDSTTWGGGTKIDASTVTQAGCASTPYTASKCTYDQGIAQ